MYAASDNASGRTGPQRVRRRHVLYIPGYDPFPARRYRELYRTEGARQSAISGYEIAQSPGSQPGDWYVRTRIAGQVSEAQIEVLEWSDIVRGSMPGGILAVYVALARTAWVYVGTGAFRRLTWLRKGPVLAGLYPVAMLLLQAAIAAATAGLLGGLVYRTTAVAGAGWVAALAVFLIGLRLFGRLDRRLYAHYLMNDFAFAASARGAWPPAMGPRLRAFADRIETVIISDRLDEVLVVGHSSGAQIAVSVLADLERRGRIPAGVPRVSLLTLGQAIPMMSFLPEAGGLRRDLATLSETSAIDWVDVSAPADGCAFALCDPVAVSGVATAASHQPLVLSAAFSQTLAPETYARLRWRFLRLHFQYLCAFDRPGAYDYFAITAGPLTLGDRFRGRVNSTQRIDLPASRFTSLAA